MRHKKKGRKLGRKVGNRRALFMNLASQMITHKRIKTTDSKAKELRTYRALNYIGKEKRFAF